MALQDVFSIDKAKNKVMKIERLQSRTLPFKGAAERTSDNTRAQQGSTSSERPPARKAIDTPPTNPTTPTTNGKKNPYAKLGIGKVYKCGELEYRSNECPKRRPVNMADYENEDSTDRDCTGRF